jgi:hypothetical protein
MKLTDYYKMQELKVIKSHRFDCVASTGNYEPFELIAQKARNKSFFVYYGNVPEGFVEDAKRGADKAITNGKNISSVYVPDLDNSLYGYGDTKNTDDALLFLFSDDYKQLEIFVARGLKNNVKGLYTLFIDGELDEEIDLLRKAAKQIE